MDWVKNNVETFIPRTCIHGIAFGNEFLGGGDHEIWEVLVPALKNIQTTLDLFHLAEDVEVSSPHSAGVFASSFPPSAGASKSNQYPNTYLVQIEGVNTKEEVGWYQWKHMACVYKAKVKKNGAHYRDLGLECSCTQAIFKVSLMRTTMEENKKFAAFIAQKLNKSSSNMVRPRVNCSGLMMNV
ncbi:unnamed protein product [Lactuca virosa]|uniref:Uncharacterized protein n=1 Tax=Lactuca virosa TaxID=75947 RepID=A0AAU9NFB3_9ASTR|nr:unnamed protein product [Lactuca virosa]